MTEIELELISDTDMNLFIEKGIRRSISYITKRFSKANNKYMQFYDDKKLSKYITYLDANNLYGWAMSQYLPYGEFKWSNQKLIVNSIECNSTKENSPDELYELHNDYPLAPKKLEISHDMLSNYCSNFANAYGIKFGGANKLFPNLGNNSKYVLHYINLQLYLSLGIKLVSVPKTLKFKQSDWLKKYIDFNTNKIKNAANSFKKDFIKLINNSVQGKTMENLRKRIKVRLVNNDKSYIQYTNKPSFVSQKKFNKNFIAIHEIKPVFTLDKPISVGFSILDLSKLVMYEFHYKYIKSKYNAKLVFTDTDSLVYKIKTCDVY